VRALAEEHGPVTPGDRDQVDRFVDLFGQVVAVRQALQEQAFHAHAAAVAQPGNTDATAKDRHAREALDGFHAKLLGCVLDTRWIRKSGTSCLAPLSASITAGWTGLEGARRGERW
jgi:hypothetical protein